MSEEQDRHSRALDAELIADPDERAKREARNGLKQFDAVIELIEHFSKNSNCDCLTYCIFTELLWMESVSMRATSVPRGLALAVASMSRWKPTWFLEPSRRCVSTLTKSGRRVHPSIWLPTPLWRLNWIHPFTDGNGRTARALSYLLLCLRLGYRIPGTNTIPDQISKDKMPYYKALEAADAAWAAKKIDLSTLEEYVGDLLANQLISVHEAATGGKK